MSGEPLLSCAGTIAKGDTSQLTLSPVDESSRYSSLLGLQPEDVDDELDMTFRSRSCQLADLYPGMVDRVKQAWSRQHTTEAADLVLRRYHRWRQQPSRSSFNNSSALLRHVHNKQTAQRERLDRSLKICDFAQSPLKAATSQRAWSPIEHSPGRVRRPQPQPIIVIDLTDVSETSNPAIVSLNETFDVPEPKPPSTFDFSPSRSTESPELTLRSKRLSLAHPLQANGNCVSVTDRPDDFQSPVRRSPLRSKMPMIFSRSPRASLRSPGTQCLMEGVSREPKRRRSMSETLTSAANMPLRGFCPQDPHLSFKSQPSPKHSASTSDPRRLRRHLSFNSSLHASGSSRSLEQLDDEFIKLYHRFVCQNRASIQHCPPCRFCARTREVSRGHSSSSALAALALSPHRSLLRKRHREMSWDSHPQSKRLRDECYASSPGSKRHVKEMLRRRLSPLEPRQSCNGISFSPRSSNNQPHKLQDVWMSQRSR